MAFRLEGGGQGGVVGRDGHRGHVPVLESVVLGLHQGLHVDVGAGQLLHMDPSSEAGEGDGRQLAALAVDGVGVAGVAVVGDDLHHPAVHVVLAGAVPGDLGQVQGGGAVLIPSRGKALGGRGGAHLQGQGEAQGQGGGALCFVFHGGCPPVFCVAAWRGMAVPALSPTGAFPAYGLPSLSLQEQEEIRIGWW